MIIKCVDPFEFKIIKTKSDSESPQITDDFAVVQILGCKPKISCPTTGTPAPIYTYNFPDDAE